MPRSMCAATPWAYGSRKQSGFVAYTPAWAGASVAKAERETTRQATGAYELTLVRRPGIMRLQAVVSHE